MSWIIMKWILKKNHDLFGSFSGKLNALWQKILSNETANPIGRLLDKIAELPQVRQHKVLNVRRQLSQGSYKLNDRLDVALDRILEELIIDV